MMMMKSKGTPGEAGVVEASQEHNLKNIAGQHPCRAVIIVVILMNALWSGQEDRRPLVVASEIRTVRGCDFGRLLDVPQSCAAPRWKQRSDKSP